MNKKLVSLFLVVLIFGAMSVCCFAASSVTDQMAANSAAWWIAYNAGDTATCTALHNANVALASQASSGGGSASYNSSAGTWNISTSSGTVINSGSSSSGKSNTVTYTSVDRSGNISSSSSGTYSNESIQAYKASGGTNEGLNTAYNNSANSVSNNNRYDNISVNSAEDEANVIKELQGLSDEEAEDLRVRLELSKQSYDSAKSAYDDAVASGDEEAAARAKQEMDAAHNDAQKVRQDYGYTGDSLDYTDGGYIYMDNNKKNASSGNSSNASNESSGDGGKNGNYTEPVIEFESVELTDSDGRKINNAEIKSGYGIFARAKINTEGVYHVRMNATYDFGKGLKTATLDNIPYNTFEFCINPDSPTGARCVYIPVDTKDGKYTITFRVFAEDEQGNPVIVSKDETIYVHGSMYDDDFTVDR